MKNLRYIIVLLILFGCSKPIPQFDLCNTDSDCIKVDDYGCCSCYAGGEAYAHNKEYPEGMECYCSEIRQVEQQHWTCLPNAIPRCIENSCILINQSN